MTVNDSLHFIGGVFQGIVQTDNINYTLACMNGTEELAIDIENMIFDFMSLNFLDWIEGLNAIKKFIFVDLLPTFENCVEVPEDFIRLT